MLFAAPSMYIFFLARDHAARRKTHEQAHRQRCERMLALVSNHRDGRVGVHCARGVRPPLSGWETSPKRRFRPFSSGACKPALRANASHSTEFTIILTVASVRSGYVDGA